MKATRAGTLQHRNDDAVFGGVRMKRRRIAGQWGLGKFNVEPPVRFT